MTICLLIYIIFYKETIQTRNLSELNYHQAKFLFLFEYDRVNPIT